MKYFTILFVISNLLANGTLMAQYNGDVGSGSNSTYYNSSLCNHFLGGNNSGYNSYYFPYSILCKGYVGGENSGQTSTFMVYSLLCQSYKGNNFSGQTVGIFNNPNSCVQYTASETGGSGNDSRNLYEDLGECIFIALPIDGSPLFAEIVESKGYLSWKTYSEVNNQGFDIMKSIDGINWEKIGWVDGAINSSSELNYNFTDDNLSVGNNYYLYQQVDMDGKSKVSNIVNLNLEQIQTLSDMFVVYPNPIGSNEYLQIRSWTKKDLDVEIVLKDAVGRILQNEQFSFSSGEQTIKLPVNYSSGNYYITIIILADGMVKTMPFVIK